jgi:hypothetical protein
MHRRWMTEMTETTKTPASPSRVRTLSSLEALRAQYGRGAAARKLGLLKALQAPLRTAREVERLHETLCFLRAYPDDGRVLAATESMLARFAARPDLLRHREALAGTGIAGTAIHYRFFAPTARWLASLWPRQLRLDRDDDEAAERIAAMLPLLATEAEAAWLRTARPDAWAAIDALRGADTDATFLVKRLAALPGDDRTREFIADGIDASFTLQPSRDTPARTLARCAFAPRAFRRQPFAQVRPDLRAEIARAPRRIRRVTARRGAELIALARAAMVTRARDLNAFAYGDPRDVHLVDDGGGLAFALIGTEPARREWLPATYGLLTLQNGVPAGYCQLDVAGPSAAVSFNVFETFRGSEAARTFARLLALAHHVLGARSFSIEPYQLGLGNDEGIDSGAWWFYTKLGFAPRDAAARRLARREVARRSRRKGYRSSDATLRELARAHLFLELDPRQRHGLPPVRTLGRRVAAAVAATGLDREAAIARLDARARALVGADRLAGLTRGERLSWQCWAPVIAVLPGIDGWTAADRAALADVVRAKGGRSELEFLDCFRTHPRLAAALEQLRDRRDG